MSTPPTLLTLPAEIRELIYTKLLSPIEVKKPMENDPEGHKHYRFDLRVLRTNRQVHAEARAVFRRLNVFVAIETPWPEAQEHVRLEGFVPLVITGDAALAFKPVHLRVHINVLQYSRQQLRDWSPQRFIILREDLEAFCQMWMYSDLGHVGMNAHLTLLLDLQDPYAAEYDGAALPKALQKQLLEPFGCIKGLDAVSVTGKHYQSIEQAVRDAMAVPYRSPEQCLEEGNRLKDEGNVTLQAVRYRDAIRLYEQAFLAIHIVCEGRRRSVWADGYFQTMLREGEWKGQQAHSVRVLLRARLVANIVLAYVKLEDFEEAHFWGMRTINLLQEGLGDYWQGPDFGAAKEVGKIYYRTALASKALGDKSEARSHLAAAIKFLPHDPIVRKELESLALPLM